MIKQTYTKHTSYNDGNTNLTTQKEVYVMKTMKTLGRTFVGETIMLLVLWAMVIIDENSYMDADSIMISLAWWAISMCVTYLGYHIWKAVSGDIKEIKSWMKERRAKKAKAMKSEYAQKIEAMYS